MGYLFGAFLVFWAITFGYLVYLGSRQRQLERELALLCQERSGVDGRP
jgi:CcmD family protein